MQDTLHQHSPTISICGRPVCNLHLADDIDLIAGSQAELQVLADKLVASSKAFGMEWKASADEDDKRRPGVITSRDGPEWQCTNWSGQPQTEMHGDRKLLLLPLDPPDDPTGRGIEKVNSAFINGAETVHRER
ncbi:hypothetical protein ElyMa_002676300 [Elysia marginata]|uniref:Reverse transcriptase domain-containing protein n=1 Tax=Elysia marginata TaxID=1093978 RepID=A0AAV4HBD1_9GAST|nr:hypothetical protein ElyMa_002676300 [Elysia marginata]